MSKISEYLDEATGYDAEGLPASSTQFVFGFAPFQMAETENIEDVSKIATICESDSVIDIKIVDNFAMVSFDFSNEAQTLAEFVEELDRYKDQYDHVTQSLNQLTADLDLAERNEDEKAVEDIQNQIRSLDVPFMLPTILPVCFGGTVQIGFASDPKFIFYTSDQLNQHPYKVTMIFEASDIFAQDEVAVYTMDAEDEIAAQQEEMWYAQEQKKAEEEAYQSQYGYNPYDYDDDDDDTDKRLKGVRIK